MAPTRARDASQPTFPVAVAWDVRIPVRDGLELSANVWRPDSPARVPAILEMIPYGKDSWRRNGDVARGEWLAARGYALVRLDVRGTGSSPGVALDEYTEAETRDGYDAVEWLAAQPWCTGRVGMWGISYGGFTSIQVAKLGPPHLAAIAPMYATDDRYLDDVHYRGGCRTASELSQYAVSQLGMNAMPPDPAFRGAAWRDEWRARLDATPPWLLAWFREQTDGPYWRRGSLAPEYAAIRIPILHFAGWSDSYVDAAFRIQERCVDSPGRRIIVGNWVHSFPDDAYPGPNIDWLHELVRFFDRYLKGVPNGWEDEPAVVWFEREYAPPEPFPAVWPGRWRAAAGYPVTGTEALEVDLGPGELGLARVEHATDTLRHLATVGTAGPLSWGAGSPPNGLARDLRPDEARGLTYTSAALSGDLAILGVPEVVLRVEATMPVATLVARLSDVAPDGSSFLVSAGVLNLTHRRSHADPEPLVPGVADEVRIPLRAAGYRWSAGHRIRLTLLSSSWPNLWPSPHPGEIVVHRGSATSSCLRLPVLPDEAPALPVPAFRTEPAGLRAVGGGTDDEPEWRIEEDVLAGTVTVRIFEGGSSLLEDGRELYSSERLAMTASDSDPAHTRFETDVVYRWDAGTFRTDIRARGTITSDAEAFVVDVDLEIDLDGERFWARRWEERIPRRLV